MSFIARFVIVGLALVVLAPARAQEGGRPPRSNLPGAQACLDQKERRAAIESGRVIRLSAAIRAARTGLPGAVVRARLCSGDHGLVYVLTVLHRNGRVTRLTVDAVKGTVVGVR